MFNIFFNDIPTEFLKRIKFQNGFGMENFSQFKIDLINTFKNVEKSQVIVVFVMALYIFLMRLQHGFFIKKFIGPCIGLKQSQTKRFSENSFKFLFHSFETILDFAALYYYPKIMAENLFVNDYNCFLFNMIYLTNLGFYISAIPTTLFIDVWKHDSKILIIHHFVSIFLIVFSFLTKNMNIGVFVFALHNVNDIFVELAKMFSALKHSANDKKTKKKHATICTIFFIVFTISWPITRVYLYFKHIVFGAIMNYQVNKPFYWVYVLLSTSLWIIHLTWTYLIFEIVFRVLKNRNLDDIKENDDEVNDDVNEKTSKKTK